MAIHILENLLPLPIMRFGMTCKIFYRYALLSMGSVHNYLAIANDQLKYNVEKLYDMYQERLMENEERLALKRLILAALPPPTNGFETIWYRKYRDSLFADKRIDCANIHISGRYIELCRMILKHKLFFQHDSRGVRKTKYIDLALQQPTVFTNITGWGDFAASAEPEAAARLAPFVHTKTSVMQSMFRDPSLNEIVQSGVPLNHHELYMMCTLATSDNHANVLSLLEKFADQKIAVFLPVLLKFGSPSIFEVIWKKIRLSEGRKLSIVPFIANREFTVSLQLYMLIRGRPVVSRIFEFLSTFDPFNKEFGRVDTVFIKWPIVIEAAILFFNNEDLIETLVKKFQIGVTWADYVLASVKKMSTRLSYILLNDVQEDSFEGFNFCVKGAAGAPSYLKLHPAPAALHVMVQTSVDNISYDDLAYYLCSTSAPRFDLIEMALLNSKPDQHAYICTMFASYLNRAKSPIEEAVKLARFSVDHRVYFRSCPKAYGAILTSAFDLPLEELLAYIPSDIGPLIENRNDRHHNSVLWALANVFKRPNGFSILQEHLKFKQHHYFIRILFDRANVDLAELVTESVNFKNLSGWLTDMRHYLDMEVDWFKECLGAASQYVTVDGVSRLIRGCLSFLQSYDKESYMLDLTANQVCYLISNEPEIAIAIGLSKNLCGMVKSLCLNDALFSAILAIEHMSASARLVMRGNFMTVFGVDIDELGK